MARVKAVVFQNGTYLIKLDSFRLQKLKFNSSCIKIEDWVEERILWEIQLRKSFTRQSGMSLIEVMVVLAIMSVLIYGMAGMFEQLQKQQSMLAMNSTYQNIHNQIVGALQSKAGWAGTVKDALNAEMACLRTSTSCAVNNTTPIWHELAVRNGDTAGADTLVLDSGVVTRGFTISGAPCNTFVRPGGMPAQPGDPQPGDDPATGNNACPIGFRVQWSGSCSNGAAGATTCTAPSIGVWIVALWNPGAGITLGHPNLSKFSTVINRGAGVMNEPLIAYEGIVGNGGTGTCNPGSWVPRGLNSSANDTGLDPADNIQSVASSMELKQGEYECTAYVPGFAVDVFQARMRLEGTTVGTGSAFAGRWAQATAVVNAKFNVNVVPPATGTLSIEMNCKSSSGTGFDFGLPTEPYAGGVPGGINSQRLTTVQCSRVN